MTATNCLQGIRCPKCKQEDIFVVEMMANFTLTDDGVEQDGDTHWDDNSPMSCDNSSCNYSGKAAEFKIENQEG